MVGVFSVSFIVLYAHPKILASIFKRMSDTPEIQYSSALDYTAAYKVCDSLHVNDFLIMVYFGRNTQYIAKCQCSLLDKNVH